MIHIYSSFRDEEGNSIKGRIKLFIRQTDEVGNIELFQSGIMVSPEENGTMFIVDDWLIPQIDKVQFKDGILLVKDGEELIPPDKTEKELQIEAIERQLAALKAELDEPVDIEEHTEAPLLNYTEQPTE